MISWGISTAIDLSGCDIERITNPDTIRQYIHDLCKLIDMKMYGDTIIELFGSGNKHGYSVVQLIETSCITAHFANDTRCAYIDIFSCKEYDPDTAAQFSMEYFGADDMVYQTLDRGLA